MDQWTSADRCLGKSRTVGVSRWGILEVEVPSSSGGRLEWSKSRSGSDGIGASAESAGVEKNEEVTYPYCSRPVFPEHPRSLWPHPRPIEPMARLCYTQTIHPNDHHKETKQTDAHTSDHQIYAPVCQECQALRGRVYIRDLARFYDRIGRCEGATGGVNHPRAWIDAQDFLERR